MEPVLIVVIALAVVVQLLALYFVIRLAVTHAVEGVLNRVNVDRLREPFKAPPMIVTGDASND